MEMCPHKDMEKLGSRWEGWDLNPHTSDSIPVALSTELQGLQQAMGIKDAVSFNNKIDDDYKTFTGCFDALKRHFQEL